MESLPVGDAGDLGNDNFEETSDVQLPIEVPADMFQQMKDRGKKEQEIHQIIVK